MGAQNLHFTYSLPKHWVCKCAPCTHSSTAPVAIKAAGLKKKSAASVITAKVCASACGPGLNHSKNLMNGNFAAFTPTDSILPKWKDQKPLSTYVKCSRGWQHFKSRFFPLKMTSFPQGIFSNHL